VRAREERDREVSERETVCAKMKRPLSRLLLPVAHFLCFVVFVQATTVHVPSSTETNRRANLSARGGKSVEYSPVDPKVMKRFADNSRMPSLFTPEQGVYDKYAACLAATEGLRRLRDQELAEEVQRASVENTSTGGSVDVLEAQRHVTAQYVQNAGKVLRALGMSINQFNELGRQIAQDKTLKEKVSQIRAVIIVPCSHFGLIPKLDPHSFSWHSLYSGNVNRS
jgi:hypothetical protein